MCVCVCIYIYIYIYTHTQYIHEYITFSQYIIIDTYDVNVVFNAHGSYMIMYENLLPNGYLNIYIYIYIYACIHMSIIQNLKTSPKKFCIKVEKSELV